ncbi:MAG: hypothetical protein GX804_01075 [Lentisphaerae bacterium]|jgi:hypothetical protein|nr:hypothetical protein [Lentisphaerota bacterium]
MNSKKTIKIHWTWEEWLLSRKARKEATAKIGPSVTRRKKSSSDKRLRAAFDGERGPKFDNKAAGIASTATDSKD